MDLSFTRFEKTTPLGPLGPLGPLPQDLAILLVDVAARQAASATAVHHARLTRTIFDETLFTPLDGAFNGPVAATLARWRQG